MKVKSQLLEFWSIGDLLSKKIDLTIRRVSDLKDQGYLIKKERTVSQVEGHPYDLVVGKIEKDGSDEEIELIGFEIKSDVDDFSRLDYQLNRRN